MTAPDKKCEHKNQYRLTAMYDWCTDCGAYKNNESKNWQLPTRPAAEERCKKSDCECGGDAILPPPSGLVELYENALRDLIFNAMQHAVGLEYSFIYRQIEKRWAARDEYIAEKVKEFCSRFGVPGARESRPHITVKEIESFLIHPTATEVRSGNGFVNAYDWCVSFGQDKLAQAIHKLFKKGGE